MIAIGTSPYKHLPASAYWKPSVAEKSALQISGLWSPKFSISRQDIIATTGSCFAQHISRTLKKNGFSWLDSEPAPEGMDLTTQKANNYGVFSFRTGNIYTAALLKQWVSWAVNEQDPTELEVWSTLEKTFIDPFRPQITPTGFTTKEDLFEARAQTLTSIKAAISQMDVFIFTLGLTEAWTNAKDHTVYPMCPGTIAGEYDPNIHTFINYQYPDIRKCLRETFDLMKQYNPGLRFLLTVSPVPLTATASGEHVLTATIHSKSVLRAVAGDMAQTRKDTDYFPSYEIISSFPFKGMFYESNKRNVAPEGVDFVMRAFLDAQNVQIENSIAPVLVQSAEADALDEEVCEEALLGEQFNEQEKICFIGSSHLGVLRQAWETQLHSGNNHISASFFGAVGSGLSSLYVDENSLKSDLEKVREGFLKTSGGYTKINIPDYDAFLIYDLGFPLKTLRDFLKQDHTSPSPAAAEFLDSHIKKSQTFSLVEKIRSVTDKPIVIAATPNWAYLEKDSNNASYDAILSRGNYYFDLYWKIAENIFKPMNATLIKQVPETTQETYFTQSEFLMGYSTNSMQDHGHMGLKYGILALQHILQGHLMSK